MQKALDQINTGLRDGSTSVDVFNDRQFRGPGFQATLPRAQMAWKSNKRKLVEETDSSTASAQTACRMKKPKPSRTHGKNLPMTDRPASPSTSLPPPDAELPTASAPPPAISDLQPAAPKTESIEKRRKKDARKRRKALKRQAAAKARIAAGAFASAGLVEKPGDLQADE